VKLESVDPGGRQVPLFRGMDWFLLGFATGMLVTGTVVGIWLTLGAPA